MPEVVSRIIAGVEALLIAVPTTLLALFGLVAFPALLLESRLPVPSTIGLIAVTCSIAGLVAGWNLLARFISGGRQRLRAAPKIFWVLSMAGATLALIGLTTWLLPRRMPNFLVENFILYAYGVPTLIPLAHLYFEGSTRSNNRLQRTGEG